MADAAEIDAIEQGFSAGAQCAVSVHTDAGETLRLSSSGKEEASVSSVYLQRK